MSKPRSVKQKTNALTDELAALSRGEPRSWAQVSHLLDQAEQTGYWKNEAKSFTEWLKSLAGSFDLKESTLWRYLTAGRYYVQLRETLAGRKISCPPLEHLSDKVSPENLELLSKLARVAPNDVLQRLAEQVINGSITRAELRTTWQAYRPVLGGRTARGGGVLAPRINLKDRTQFDSLMEAMVFTTLSSDGAGWTGIANPDLYELFMQVHPEYAGRRSTYRIFDALAVVRERKNSPLEIHGIEIAGGFHINMRGKFEGMAPFCNFLWLAIPESANRISKLDIPDFVGVLRAVGSGLIVERPAGPSELLGTELLAMTKGLLLKTLKR